MKKAFVALAVTSLAGVASGQSSVTLFGVMDAAVSRSSNRAQNLVGNRGVVDTRRTELRNSGYNSSRLGFRGTEDLGGGLSAGFWLEAPISNDDGGQGALNFTRRSTVSLAGGFGELRLGRDFTPSLWNDQIFDPFGANGVGGSLVYSASSTFTSFAPSLVPASGLSGLVASNYVRASNSVGYFLPPSLGGFYGQVMYALNERTKSGSDLSLPRVGTTGNAGRYVGGRFGYTSGPLDVALAYGESTASSTYFQGADDVVKTANIGFSYDFNFLKLFGEFSRSKHEVDFSGQVAAVAMPDAELKGFLLGVTVPVGPGLVRATYAQVRYDLGVQSSALPSVGREPKAGKVAIGYVHNFSKRTALYATVARIENRNGANLSVGGPAFFNSAARTFAPLRSTGYDLGIRHAF